MSVAPHVFDNPRPASAIEVGRTALRQSRTLVADYALLAVLEARSAGLKLAWMLSGGLVIAVLLVTAWIALVAGGMVWLLGQGFPWPGALAIAAGLNVLAAVAVGVWLRGLFADVPFAATVRQLRGENPPTEAVRAGERP